MMSIMRVSPCQLTANCKTPVGVAFNQLATDDQYLTDGDSFGILGYNLEIVGPQSELIREHGTMHVVLCGTVHLPPVRMSQIPPYFHKTINLVDGAETPAEIERVEALLRDIPKLRASQTTYFRLEVGKYRPRLNKNEKYHFVFAFPGLCVADSNEIRAHLNGLLFSEIKS